MTSAGRPGPGTANSRRDPWRCSGTHANSRATVTREVAHPPRHPCCPHSLCPASQRPLRWRRPGVHRRRPRSSTTSSRGNVTFDGRAARRRRASRSKATATMPRPRPTPTAGGARRAREGRVQLTLDEDTLPEGVVVAEGQNPVTAEFGLTEPQGGELLPRRGHRARRPTSAPRCSIRVINGLNFGLLLALAAIGLSLIFGTTGLSNFAHARDGHLRRADGPHVRRRPGVADLARDHHRAGAERGARAGRSTPASGDRCAKRASGSSSS